MNYAPTIPAGADWIEHVRGLVQKQGLPVRAGAGDTIEIKANHGAWMPLELAIGGVIWPTTAERDAALKRLQTP